MTAEDEMRPRRLLDHMIWLWTRFQKLLTTFTMTVAYAQLHFVYLPSEHSDRVCRLPRGFY